MSYASVFSRLDPELVPGTSVYGTESGSDLVASSATHHVSITRSLPLSVPYRRLIVIRQGVIWMSIKTFISLVITLSLCSLFTYGQTGRVSSTRTRKVASEVTQPKGPSGTSASSELPLTWRRDYFPEFRIEIADADLERLMTVPINKDNPDLTKYPIKLHYQGQEIKGTIRLRGGNASRCGNKRQFRIDFPKKVALPDGYKTDRFETDHGICNTLNEWLGWQMIDEAAARHPELTVLRKHSNVVALYFNDRLYHVQTLLEDVDKDLIERHLQTRNVVQFKHGCYFIEKGSQTEISELCRTTDPVHLNEMMEVCEFLYVNALVQVLGSMDNYPAYPWNWYLIYNKDTGRTHFLPDDLDMTINYLSGAQHDPYSIVYTENFAQQQFESLVADPTWGAVYRQDVQELTVLIAPQFFLPIATAKYEQVRDTLLACPDLPFGAEYYDAQYRSLMQAWSPERFSYLNSLTNSAPQPKLSFFGTTLGSDGEPYAVVATDLNNDGQPDLAIANVDAGIVTLITGLKDGAYWWGTEVKSLNVGGNPVAIAALDADGDGWNDLAVADYSGDAVTVWRNQRDGTFARLAAMSVSKPLSLSATRISDGVTVLLAVSDGPNSESNLRRARVSEGALEELPPLSVGAWPQPPAIADLNNDGQPDAVLANAFDNQLVTIFDVMSDTPRITRTLCPVAIGPIVAADFDQDGLIDVAALASDANQLLRWRNQGGGVLALEQTVALPTGYWLGYYAAITAADFDGDGLPEVVITDYTEGIIRIYRGSRAGFSNARSEWVGTGNKGYGTITTDLNQDGKPDIVALAGHQGWVSVHLNRSGFVR